MPDSAAGRGRPRPRSPPRDAASSREAWPPAGVSGDADLPGLQRPGRGPPSLLSSGPAGGAALTCLWARAVAAAQPGKGRSAARRPGTRRGEERGAKGEGRGRRTRSSVPAKRAGLDAAAPGASGRSVRTPVSPRRHRRDSGNRPREEPQPERLGKEAKQGRGHRVGDPLTRKQLWPQRRAMRHQLDTGPPRCSRLSRGDLLVAQGAVLLPPGSATVSCRWGCAGGSAAGRDRRWGGGPGRPRGGSSGPAVPAQRLRPQDQGQECELMRVPVQGCTCPGHR